jgi:hypothetical protein
MTANLQSATNNLGKFVRHLHSTPSAPQSSVPEVFFSWADLGGLLLWGEDADQYRNCMRSFYKATAESTKLSHRTVDTAVQRAILMSLDPVKLQGGVRFERRLQDALSELGVALDVAPQPWEVHLLVHGVEKTTLPIRFGPAEFYYCDDIRAAYLHDKAERVLQRQGQREPNLERNKRIFGKEIESEFRGKCFARVNVEAPDDGAAFAMATDYLSETLDALNMFVGVLFSGSCAAAMPGDAPRSLSLAALFAEGAKPYLTQHHGHRGHWVPMDMSQLDSPGARKVGVARLSRIVASTQRNTFETRLLSSIRWAGQASVMNSPDQALVLYLVALEALLLGKKRSTSLELRLRLAHLLGLSLEGKREIMRRAAQLYALRSAVVHEGSSIVTTEDISAAAYWTKNAIIGVLTDPEFSSMSEARELDGWFEEEILA